MGKICCLFGLFATTVGILVSFCLLYWLVVAGFWIVLFFGGAILPPATGMLITVVDPETRPLANAFSMFIYNIFGYALGSFLPGLVMQFLTRHGTLGNELSVEQWGMRLILWWAVFGCLGMFFAWIFARKKKVAEEGGLVSASSSEASLCASDSQASASDDE